ncbi:MAG: carbohydrate binding family 9 domain-containing protein [Acidobacteria bacterium]|nr:carbohydrate binding family 9 domain-containing protein [Acidobacteriota bacterium]
MKRSLCFFALIIILSIEAFAQGNGGSAASSASSTGKADDGSKVVGGVTVPAEKLRPVTIPKAVSAPIIDGKIDDEAWKNAAVFKDFYQTQPGYNVPASKPTEVYMVYDEHNLYVAFKCFDEKDKIRATVAKRDNVFGEDNVRMWLDTYNDQRRAYVLGFNPYGVQQDGIFTEGQGPDFSIDIVMESKGVIEDWGWSVEVKIPFKSIRYTAGKGKQWGFSVARNIDRLNDEFDEWLPDDRNVSGFLIKHGHITGLDDVKWERTVEIVPSFTAKTTGKRVRNIPRYLPGAANDPGRFENGPIKGDPGLNLKYTITPSVTLDAAINPDFAEIEADAPVVTANQRFPIFFQEKRPFFLEGAEIFQSPIAMYYSRNIVDPDAAVKLTGKLGKTSFGILGAIDRAPGNYSDEDRSDPTTFPSIKEFVDKKAYFAVLRLKRDFGKENYIGFFSTFRTFPEQHTVNASVDAKIKFNPKLVSAMQINFTNSKRCFFQATFEPLKDPLQAAQNKAICGTGMTGGALNASQYNQYRVRDGFAYYANFDYTTERHGWNLEIGGRSHDYRPDVGFRRQTDNNWINFYNRYSTKSKPKAKLINGTWAQFAGYNYDFKGRIQSWDVGTNINASFQHSIFLYAETGTEFQKIYEEEFGLKREPTRPFGTFLDQGTRERHGQWFSTNINQVVNKHFNYGAFVGFIHNAFDYFHYDFSPAANSYLLNPGTGNQFDAQVAVSYKPINALSMSGSYTKSRLVRDDTHKLAYSTDLATVKATYQFTRFIFARVRVDYDRQSRNYSGQALFGWNPNPGTAFYIGYNDNFNYFGWNPYTGIQQPGFARNERTFFIRGSYLFRKSF